MNTYQDKLSRSGFRFVEKLLYDMKKHDTAMIALEVELETVLEQIADMYTLKASTIDDMPHGTGTSSPTENMAIKRADNLQVKFLKDRIEEMKRHKAAILKAMDYMTDTEKLLIKLKYDHEKTSRACWESMHIEKSRWYEIWQITVYKVAEYLGIT